MVEEEWSYWLQPWAIFKETKMVQSAAFSRSWTYCVLLSRFSRWATLTLWIFCTHGLPNNIGFPVWVKFTYTLSLLACSTFHRSPLIASGCFSSLITSSKKFALYHSERNRLVNKVRNWRTVGCVSRALRIQSCWFSECTWCFALMLWVLYSEGWIQK